MESLKKIHNKVIKEVDGLKISELESHFTLIGFGQLCEICEESERPNGYYKWLHCYTKLFKPKQILELGAAAGISTMMMATGNPDSKIISVDCDPSAWRWMNRDYPNVTKILGDDLDLDNFIGVNLSATDLFFFDSLHTKAQLSAELDLFEPFFNKGTILVFDDIHINKGMNEVWDSLPYEKLDISERLHYCGFGLARVK